MEKSNNSMQLKQSFPAQGYSNTGKYPPSKSPQAAGKPIVTSIPKISSSNVKSSPHASTSRSSAPSGVTSATQMDSDSDDEKPIVFRNVEARASMLKVQPRNGLVSPKAEVNGVKAGVGSVLHKSSLQTSGVASVQKNTLQTSDDSEDEKPLMTRIAQRYTTIQGNATGLSDSDDEKPLYLRRISNGADVSKTLMKGDNSNQKKRPNDGITKDESSAKKLKLSSPPSKLSNVPQVPKFPSSKPFNSVSKTEKTTPLRTSSSTVSKSSTVASKPSSISSTTPVTKASSTVPPKPTSSSNKPSIVTAKSTSSSNKPSIVTAKSTFVSKRPSAISSKSSIPQSGVSSNRPVKMDIDEDEDDIPLAQRMPLAVKNVKKPVVKPSTGSLSSSMAAKKVVEARKAKLKQQQKQLMKKKKREHDARRDKNAPGADGGQKWTRLEHNGVIFPPPYQPHGVKMLYERKPVNLTPEQEEVATMFAVMRETEYVQKQTFLSNFWEDWKKILGPRHVIQSLEGCDFTPIYEWHLAEKEKKKLMSTEEKKRIKEEKLKQEEKYMWALVDGIKEKVGNFRVEPPGLFRGRGEHPKMGKLKRRIFPEDIVINISKGAPIPECPIPGHRWKEIRHDNTVTWLAYWIDPINQKEFKYVFLSASSNLKGQSDKEKYEKARTLKDYIEDIRKTYTKNFTSSDMTKKQIAVATYLIDRLALRAGNEKDDDEADTVGCCSLKVEHVTLVPPKSLQFDFLGKDSIRYFNVVEVEEAVFKAVGEFKKSKANGDDLFDKLDTNKLNAHLKNIMPQLTAKVFRTYNASITLDRLLVGTGGQTVAEKIAAYQSANKEVAILCNHQRSVSKSHGAQMEKLEAKMTELEELLQELRIDLARAKKGKPPLKGADGKPKRNQSPEALEKKIAQTEQKIEKMKLDMRIKDDLKTVALGTSKINYMDPRITVAWCKRHEVPIEKIFNKSLLAKFAWAMDVSMDYRF